MRVSFEFNLGFGLMGHKSEKTNPPNLSREAVHLGFSGFARVYLGFDPGSPGFTWVLLVLVAQSGPAPLCFSPSRILLKA